MWQWDELGGRRRLPSDASSAAPTFWYDRDDGRGEGGRRIVPATEEQRALPPSPKGKLKWGVGKLIAHAPVTPKVIPFAHCGMETLLPQDEHTGRTKLRDDPLGPLVVQVKEMFGLQDGDGVDGLHVKIRFGEEIRFDDLIREHEAKHGTLWKYSGNVDAEELENGRSRGGFHKHWDSSREERELYSKIARRIEVHLEGLTREVHDSWAGTPAVAAKEENRR